MKIVVIANQKGGAGKTTITMHLAVSAEADGAGPVALIDTDPQASLADWWNSRQAATPTFANVKLDSLVADLERLKQAGTKLVFIDTPPQVTETIRKVVAIADLVVIPSRPSPLDLRATTKTVELVEQEGKPMIFVVNGAAQKARITGEAAIMLSQFGKVAPVILFQRTDFAQALNDGRVAQELDTKSRAATEIDALWKYVRTQLRI
jgi:chromosome partitioning protein